MVIELIDFGFKPARELFSELKGFNFKRVDAISDSADVAIICIEDEHAACFLESANIPKSCFTIFCVFTLTGAAIPNLKTADHIIWFGPMQERIVREVAGFTYPGKSIQFPVAPVKSTGKENVLTVTGKRFTMDNISWYREVVDCAKDWFTAELDGIVTLLITADQNDSEAFEQFRTEIMAELSEYPLQIRGTYECSSDEIRDLIANASRGEYFRPELSVEQLDQMIDNTDIALFFMPIESDQIVELLRSSSIKLVDGYKGLIRSLLTDGNEPFTIDQFESYLTSVIEIDRPATIAAAVKRTAETEVDSLETLDIVTGKPLSNRYIFSICFRNQEQKIVRALESIVAQNGSFDIGIAIVDDGSADRSSELILEYLSGKNIDFVLVKNKVRRFASRNFYNIINFLTEGENSVIIELDGDDFLHGEDVLIRLDQEYSKGILKTAGSFVTWPDSENPVAKNLLEQHGNCDFSRPWSLSACRAWLPLRSCHRTIASKVELDYFLDRETGSWLAERHDSISNSRMIELAGADRCSYIDEPLYVYDLSGVDHDHGASEEFDRTAAYIKLFHDLQKYYRAYSL